MHSIPEYHTQEEYINRSRKLEEIRAAGLEPYPHHYDPTYTIVDLHRQFHGKPLSHSEEAAAGETPSVRVAGRLVLFRSMGKNAFAQIQEGSNRVQIMFNRDLTELDGYTPQEGGLSPYKFIEKKLDLGDIIGVEGHLFRTQVGELTIYAKHVKLLSKALLPLADKHAGLADKELRYRKRWLDLISNPEVHQTFALRSRLLQIIRNTFEAAHFMEVETPVLQSIYGGAEARPFTTLLHALDQEMFMRISLEIPLKKLIVGGIQRVYEIGKVFRNEGIDRNHNPEFTLLEAYAAYWDYHDVMRFVEELFERAALALTGGTTIPAHHPTTAEPLEINLKAPWKRLTMKEAVHQYGGLDVDAMSDQEMRDKLLSSGHCPAEEVAKLSRGLLIAALFEVYAEPHLIQPHHIIDHPIETTPLCKPHRSPRERDERLVERFESFILCGEICNAYSELNDPNLQRELLEDQAARRDAGDDEASPFDEEFVEAICQGMPPTGGFGIGIDRMVMLFANAHSIRDVLFFPWMKPQQPVVTSQEPE